jgi:hypothetical protein
MNVNIGTNNRKHCKYASLKSLSNKVLCYVLSSFNAFLRFEIVKDIELPELNRLELVRGNLQK